MKTRIAALLLAGVALALALAWWRGATPRGGAAPPTASVVPAGSPAPRGRPGWAAASSTTADGDAGLPALDCDVPTGDVVTVDGVGIPATTFCAEWRRLAGSSARGATAAVEAQGRALLRRMIDARLVKRALEIAGEVVPDAVVSQTLDALLARRGQAPPARPEDVAALRRELRDRLEVERLVALRGRVEPSEAEVAAAYEAAPQRWGRPAGATVEGYLARSTSADGAEVQAQALAAAGRFAAAAPGEAAPQNLARASGLVRVPPFEVSPGKGEPAVAAAALSLSPGAWSGPIMTRAGVLVLRVLDLQPATVRPLSEVRDDVRATLTSQRTVTERERVLRELRDAARVE